MSGTLIVRDNAVWMPAGWVFDNVLELVASELQAENSSLSKALLDARTDVRGGYLDLRMLDANQFRSLVRAAGRAYERVIEEGAKAFYDPSFYEGFVKRFDDLKEL